MRAYRVSAQRDGVILKFMIAATQSDAKNKRKELMDSLSIKKNDVVIEEIEIPTSKHDLLDYINEQIGDAYYCGASYEQY